MLAEDLPDSGSFRAAERDPGPDRRLSRGCMALAAVTLAAYPVRTRVRHRTEIRTFLGIQAWDDAAEALARSRMERIVGGRTQVSDLINGAIEVLVTANYELPALSTLRWLAGRVHKRATDGEWSIPGAGWGATCRRTLMRAS